ncbi:ankyrin repeat domain-containing protein 16 [Periophthalmus magnuspinnatus]|uniref:ankyrin repeat domain-containing protein 16 n=1 Tax=Periophthalmus magnuspinnatus TaxID=409849 RepID=UPI00145A5C02|nr:ankyrin repeat domain-containing protein 16 [Periophthalmus magnuspinnatus]
MDEIVLKSLVKLTQEGDLVSLDKYMNSMVSGSVQTDLNRSMVQTVINKHFGRSGDTLMHYAARHGHLHIVKYLHKLGLHVEVYNNDYKRPLHEAASMGHLECVTYLLENGAKVNSLKKADWTPLMMACTRRNLSVIDQLLAHGADLGLKNKDGWSAFHVATREGSAEVVLLLLQHSEQVWRTESKTGRTPLHTAAMHGCEEVIKILLERCEYRPDQRDSCGVTPLMDALRNGHLSVARLLLEKHQACPTAVDRLGAQPLHQVAVTGENDALRFLVKELKVNVNESATSLQLMPLHYAAKEGHVSTILTLKELGADLQIQDAKGRTALHMASIGQHAEAVTTLLQLGLKNSPDSSGTTPQQIAKKPAVVQAFHAGL